MKSLINIGLIFTSCILLSACGSKSDILKHEPVGKSKSNAYVILGAVGNETVIAIDSTQGRYNISSKSRNQGLHMFKVKVGKRFSIKKVFVQPGSGNYERYANIANPHSVEIKKPGIYYFGTVYSNFGTIHISSRVNRLVTNKARRQYPHDFKKNVAVNF